MPARRPSASHRSAHGRHHAARRMALLLLSGLSIANVMPAITMAQDASVARPSPARSLRRPHHRGGAAVRHSRTLDSRRAASRGAGDVRAISSAGALGLMQVMPTWAALRRYRLGRDPYDPHDNIMAGAAYLREMWDRYGDVGAMLAAYNADAAGLCRRARAGSRRRGRPETSVRRADPAARLAARRRSSSCVRVDTRSAASRSANERSDDSRSSVTARLSDPARHRFAPCRRPLHPRKRP